MPNTLRNILVEFMPAAAAQLKHFTDQTDAMQSEWTAEKKSKILWTIRMPEENSRGSLTCAALKLILYCDCRREVEGPSVCAVEKHTGKAAGC